MIRKQINLRTPLSYYGGKQKLVPALLKIMPAHDSYNEVFAGGLAFFFAKEPTELELINDTNGEVINFYKVVKNRFHDLAALVRSTLHSRRQHEDASIVYAAPHLHDEVRRAWAVWVLSSQSFCAQLDGNWGYEKKDNSISKKVQNKKDQFIETLAVRLQNVQIECADANYVIQSRDREGALFYADPPYYNSCMGHYDGYTEDDFEKLLQTLSAIKGKFMLSSYPSELLKRYRKEFKWHQWSVEQGVSVNIKSGYQKRKIEVVTTNYPL